MVLKACKYLEISRRGNRSSKYGKETKRTLSLVTPKLRHKLSCLASKNYLTTYSLQILLVSMTQVVTL